MHAVKAWLLHCVAMPRSAAFIACSFAIRSRNVRVQVLELRYSFVAVRAFIRKQTADFYRLVQEESTGYTPVTGSTAARSHAGGSVADGIELTRRGGGARGVAPAASLAAGAEAAEARADEAAALVGVSTLAAAGFRHLTTGAGSTSFAAGAPRPSARASAAGLGGRTE